MTNTDLQDMCTAPVESLSEVEVDGISARDMYETPTEVSKRVGSKSLAYSGCQSCVFSQCNYSRT